VRNNQRQQKKIVIFFLSCRARYDTKDVAAKVGRLRGWLGSVPGGAAGGSRFGVQPLMARFELPKKGDLLLC
jgi:hypothetical protein